MRPHPELAERLEALSRRYGPGWLESDPIRWPRAYARDDDREVAAVVAALLAYGRVASIHRSVGEVLRRLGPRPAAALTRRARGGLAARLEGFRHRFTAGEDLVWLLTGVGHARDAAGSLGAYVAHHANGPEPLRAGLAAWHALAHGIAASTAPARRRARGFLLPDPFAGSALKRTLLLARWCVRPDDGVDLGLWNAQGRLGPKDLVLPLDTHVHRTAVDVGLTRRTVPDWKAAREATDALARLDPDDPVRFDFALVRPGIVGRCTHRTVRAICTPCELRACCAKGRRLRPAPAASTGSDSAPFASDRAG